MDVESKIPVNAGDAGDVLSAKVISMIVLGLASFILGILPIKLAKFVNVKTVEGDKNLFISLLLCFGGGVLLFTTFIHLQPEVRASFAILDIGNKIPLIRNDLPISELVFCLGFFFVYFIEELAHLILHRKTHNEVLHRSLSIRCSKKDSQIAIPRVSLNKFDDGNISCITNSNKQLLTSQSTINIDQKSLHHHHHHFHGNLKKSFSGLLAVLALSFHAIFEGLAVGLETNEQRVWYLFVAIATHKLVIAFCVGIELVTSGTKAVLTIFYIGTFSIVTPLGIGAGLLLTEGNDLDITSTILQGMAAGTLLYVVFFEVLSRERNNEHSGVYQLLAIMMGFLVMATLQIMTGHHHHEHGHTQEHHHHHHEDTLKILT